MLAAHLLPDRVPNAWFTGNGTILASQVGLLTRTPHYGQRSMFLVTLVIPRSARIEEQLLDTPTPLESLDSILTWECGCMLSYWPLPSIVPLPRWLLCCAGKFLRGMASDPNTLFLH